MCETRTFIVWAIVASTCALCSYEVVAQPDIAVVRVDGDNGSPNGNGTGWGEQAFKYLQDGLVEAAELANDPQYDHVEVWVAATDDPYRPGPPGDRTASFQLRDKVELYGGFAGNEDDLSERKIYENITVLSGDLEGDDDEPGGDRLDNSFHVVTTPPQSITTRIDGFVIRGGEADGRGVPTSDKGAGMFVQGFPIGIVNCTFTDNRAGCAEPFNDQTPGYGAALYIGSTDAPPGEPVAGPDIVNCTFYNNLAEHAGEGGALHHAGRPLAPGSARGDSSAVSVQSSTPGAKRRTAIPVDAPLGRAA